MTFELRFQALTLPTSGWANYRDQVKRVEALGFDIAAIPDHFCDWANPPGPWLEAWTSIAALAAETTTVRLATCVTQIPLRNPGVLAHQAITVDHVSEGRIELGLGTGIGIDPSLEMVGIPNWSNGERVARFGEYVELVGLMLSQPVTTYEGRYYSAQEAVMNPSSFQSPRVPVVVAALGPKMMGHTARHADIWNTMSFSPDFDDQMVEIGQRVKAMDELCLSIGRDPATLRRSCNLYDAESGTAGGRIRYYEDEDLLVDLVNQLTDMGVSDIGLYYPSLPEQLPAFEHVANEVLPSLRTEYANAR